jgi:hypothetical protein
MSKIIIKYPPDYDGELHITVLAAERWVEFQFTHSKKENEGVWETLVKAAEAIIAQNKRMAG